MPAIKTINERVATYTYFSEECYVFPNTVRSITLGKDLTQVGKDTFTGTQALTELRIEVSSPSQLSSGVFASDIINQPSSARVLVPQASVTDWNTRFPWLATQFTGGVRGY